MPRTSSVATVPTGSRPRSFFVLVAVVALLASLFVPTAAGSVGSGDVPTPPGIDSLLADIAAVAAIDGAEAALDLARSRGLRTTGGRVVVQVSSAVPDQAVDAVRWLDGRVLDVSGSTLLAALPPGTLNDLAADPSVAFVYLPPVPVVDRGQVTTEGVSAEIAGWHSAGRDGAGIRVLVLDSGFVGFEDRQASGDLPAELGGLAMGPTCDEPVEGAGSHGTATAEVVHDVAPGAELFLFRTCTLTFSEGRAIAEFILDNDIDLVTSSIGYYNTGPFDGSDPIGLFDHVNAVVGQGVVWFNSVGNQRRSHWRGTWQGAGPSLEFAPGTAGLEVALEAGTKIFLRWDDWRLGIPECSACATDLDLDLFLVDAAGDVVAASTTVQSFTRPWVPTESLVVPSDGVFRIEVRRSGFQMVSPLMDIDLLVIQGTLPREFQVRDGTMNDIAALEAVTAVGAVSCVDGLIRPYSSQGPTADGRMKPDLSAVDGVATVTYGGECDTGFLGTSASAPHAAGVAALIMQATGARGTEVPDIMARLAIPAPDGEEDRYGAGVVQVPAEFPAGTCRGRAATIVALPGQIVIVGTDGPDVIRGNGEDNVIDGRGGKDIICGRGGDDFIEGGPGRDKVWAGSGSDHVRGQRGADKLKGGSGDDVLFGGSGANRLFGGRGFDACIDGSEFKGCETIA